MKISVIIPVYNVEPYIERCLKSVAEQTHQDIEVLIIDDCGNDDSIKIAKNYLEKIPSIDKKKYKIIHHERNKGLSVARNTGLKSSTGKYVYFLDSDDAITNTCIEKLVSYAITYDVDFIMADHTRTGIIVPHRSFNLKLEYLNNNEQILKSHFSHRLYVMASNRLIKIDFVLKNNLYFQEGIFYEDELWSFMVVCKATKVFITNDKTYLYTIRADSITQNITLNHYLSKLKIIKGMVSFVHSNPELMSNNDIYDYIEELKSTYFRDILFKKMPEHFKLNFYKTLKSQRYQKKNFFIKRNELSLPQLVRNVHYSLPTQLGYHYYRLSLKMKKWLKV